MESQIHGNKWQHISFHDAKVDQYWALLEDWCFQQQCITIGKNKNSRHFGKGERTLEQLCKPTDQVKRMILEWKLNENLGNANNQDDHYVASWMVEDDI